MEVDLDAISKAVQELDISSYVAMEGNQSLIVSSIRNSFDRDIPYKIYADHPEYNVMPGFGIVKANSFELISVLFKSQTHENKCSVFIDAFEKTYQFMKMRSSGEELEFNIEPKDTLFFRPTCVQNQNHKTVTLQNGGPNYATYELSVSDEISTCISIDRDSGQLAPYSSVQIKVIYKPKADGFIQGKLAIEFS